ncbi:MAG: hypothetical protein A2986_00720 [Candidatus Jacksonbacteria bacterium RIFCSPLOWO2_01_FULL_44_13]|nr:MAG: hypothetical protein A2986_00720 [Candidatus Jacksonbacteria bacterium RIFCSPLOWO2_01_FULL_44_13]
MKRIAIFLTAFVMIIFPLESAFSYTVETPRWGVSAQDATRRTNGASLQIPGQVLVQKKGEAVPELYLFDPAQQTLDDVINQLKHASDVIHVQPNFDYDAVETRPWRVSIDETPQGGVSTVMYGDNTSFHTVATAVSNDQFISDQTYLDQIHVGPVWDHATRGSHEVVVAVIDTGLDIDHPDLMDNIWTNKDEIENNGIDDDNNGFIDDRHGWDFNHNTYQPEAKLDSKGYTVEALTHGTVVAGIIGARGNNGIGVTGIAQTVQLMGLKALNGLGHGNTLDVVKAIMYAKENGADVINMSFVGHLKDDILKDAIRDAYESGIIIVAAVGNDGASDTSDDVGDLDINPLYPGCIDEKVAGKNWILGVASVDQKDRRSRFSSFGTTCVDLVAPGEGIFNTQIWNASIGGLEKAYRGNWNGTSFAAPMVAGAAALIKSYAPGLSAKEVYDYLVYNADDIVGKNSELTGKLGFGRLSIEKAFTSIDTYAPASAFVSAYVSRQKKVIERSFFVAGAGQGMDPWVRLWSYDGILQHEFLAYDKTMKAGVSVALGDVNNDNELEIITGPATPAVSPVRVFNLKGVLLKEFQAFPSHIKVGIHIASGDVLGNSKDAIVIGAGNGGGPMIRVFNGDGEMVSQFFAGDRAGRQGISFALGDTDGNGINEIGAITSIAKKNTITFYNAYGGVERVTSVQEGALPLGRDIVIAENAVDTGEARIITGSAQGEQADVKIFSLDGRMVKTIPLFNRLLKSGITLTLADANADGKKDIIATPRRGGGPQAQMFDLDGKAIKQFFIFDKNVRKGSYVGG